MSQTMLQARIHAVNEIRLDQVDIPEPGDEDVVIRVVNCGICGSDLGYAASGGIFGPGTPMAIGHEFSGVIHRVGSGVSAFQKGQRVVVNPEANGNGIGGVSYTEAAFAPYVLVKNVNGPETALFPLSDSLSFEDGALVEPLSVGLHGLKRARYQATDKLAIFGAGPIGLGMVLLAQHAGLQDIVIVDLSEHRLSLARELGVHTLRGDDPNLAEKLMHLHGTSDLMGAAVPATSLYVEATGVGQVLTQLIGLAGTGSRIALVGVHKSPVEINPIDILIREIDLCGAMAYTTEFAEVINLLEQRSFDPKVLISHRYNLSEFLPAFAQAQQQEQAVKVMVDCRH